MKNDSFDKHMNDMNKTMNVGIIAILFMWVVGAIVSLGVVGTVLYLLVKNFG